jgi:sirohydrochlorin ferrochelatase
MKGIVLVDHGSLRAEANEMMVPVTDLIQSMAGDDVVVFPYMLSPGRHSTTDIPRMVAEAARAHPGVSYSVTPAFGVHEKLGEVVLERVGIHSTR